MTCFVTRGLRVALAANLYPRRRAAERCSNGLPSR